MHIYFHFLAERERTAEAQRHKSRSQGFGIITTSEKGRKSGKLSGYLIDASIVLKARLSLPGLLDAVQ